MASILDEEKLIDFHDLYDTGFYYQGLTIKDDGNAIWIKNKIRRGRNCELRCTISYNLHPSYTPKFCYYLKTGTKHYTLGYRGVSVRVVYWAYDGDSKLVDVLYYPSILSTNDLYALLNSIDKKLEELSCMYLIS